MSAYTSTTTQIESPHAWRCFSGMVVADSGDCFTVETRGLRATKAKGLVVRYPNPFAKGAGPAEVLHTATDAMNAIWRHPSGALHVVGKRYHTNASGAWKTTKLPEELHHVWGTGDELWAASRTRIYRASGGTWTPVDVEPKGLFVALAGTGPTDIFVSDEDGPLLHFDGKAWKRIKDAPAGAHLWPTASGVLATGISRANADDDSDKDHVLHRVTAKGCEALLRRGQAPDIGLGASQPVCEALGSIFVGGVGEAPEQWVGRLAGKKLEPVVRVTIGYADLIAGTKDVLWVHNGIELLCSNGKAWKQVRRALDGA